MPVQTRRKNKPSTSSVSAAVTENPTAKVEKKTKTANKKSSQAKRKADAVQEPVEIISTKPDATEVVKHAEKKKRASPSKSNSPKRERSPSPSHQLSSPVAKHQSEGKPAKKQKTNDSNAADDDHVGAVKDFFENVVGEIGAHGPIIKSKVLKKRQPAVTKKQDPEKLAKRRAINNEIRRVSVELNTLASDFVPPHQVKAHTKAVHANEKESATIFHKTLVGQIKEMGPSHVKNVLETKQRRIIATPRRLGYVQSADQSKRVQTKTLNELKQVVSPIAVTYRPSIVKSKVSIRKARTELHAEIAKTATVRQIKRMGKGVSSVLIHPMEQ